MIKKYQSLILFVFCFSIAKAQLIPTNTQIVDDLKFEYPDLNSAKRSIQNPKSCGVDTVEYPRYKSSSLITISVAKGRSIGQLYSCPKTVTLTGFTFYAFIASNPPSPKKMKIICRLYKAGADSLPSGSPLRADTLIIDSTFGGGLLSKIEKHATFKTINMDSNYIITVETEEDSLSAGIVINNYNNGDGDKENLNCGSISGLWYNGRNLNVGGVRFDCDILLHPHVKYKFGTDFSIKNNCYNINDSIKFINASSGNMAGSKMYNRYTNYNLEYFCHRWNLGNNTGTQYVVDHKVKYNIKQNYKVSLISLVYGYRGSMYNGCTDTTEKMVYFKPDIPTYSGLSNVCIGDTGKFSVGSLDTGVVYEWHQEPNSTTPFFTGKTYIKYPILKTDTFYIRANNNGCLGGVRMVIIKANAYPTTLNVLNDSVCAGSRANLKATSNVGAIQWYKTISGGLPFYTGTVYQTSVLLSDTTVYVQANNNGCYLFPRTAVSALVGSTFAPSPPFVSNDTTVCLSSGNTVVMTANAGAGLSVRWFSIASGGSPINTGNSFNFMPVTREVKVFYVDAYNGICGSSRVPIRIDVEDYPNISNIMTDTICLGDSARLSFTLPFGEGDWYDANAGGNLIHTGLQFNSKPNVNTDFYIETRSDVCINPNRTKLTALVNTFPMVVKLWGDTICSKNKATLKSVLNGLGYMEWFDSDTSTAVLATGNVFVTPVLNGSRKYYVRPVYAACVGPRQAVQPLVKAAPFSGFSFEVLTWQQIRVSPINAGGASIKWDFGDGTTSNNQAVTHRYINPGTYEVKLILTSLITGCKDSTSVSLDIETSNLNTTSILNQFKAYPNPVQTTLFIETNDLKGSVWIKIYDLKGVEMESILLDADTRKYELDVRHLPPGIYMLVLPSSKPAMFIKS